LGGTKLHLPQSRFLLSVFLRSQAQNCAWLEKRSFNITKRFLRIIQIFQDAKFEQQLRLEIEKVKPALIPAL
jgi:hypothetical protein